jgi:chaperonin cofactor prefoldin
MLEAEDKCDSIRKVVDDGMEEKRIAIEKAMDSKLDDVRQEVTEKFGRINMAEIMEAVEMTKKLHESMQAASQKSHDLERHLEAVQKELKETGQGARSTATWVQALQDDMEQKVKDLIHQVNHNSSSIEAKHGGLKDQQEMLKQRTENLEAISKALADSNKTAEHAMLVAKLQAEEAQQRGSERRSSESRSPGDTRGFNELASKLMDAMEVTMESRTAQSRTDEVTLQHDKRLGVLEWQAQNLERQMQTTQSDVRNIDRELHQMRVSAIGSSASKQDLNVVLAGGREVAPQPSAQWTDAPEVQRQQQQYAGAAAGYQGNEHGLAASAAAEEPMLGSKPMSSLDRAAESQRYPAASSSFNQLSADDDMTEADLAAMGNEFIFRLARSPGSSEASPAMLIRSGIPSPDESMRPAY